MEGNMQECILFLQIAFPSSSNRTVVSLSIVDFHHTRLGVNKGLNSNIFISFIVTVIINLSVFDLLIMLFSLFQAAINGVIPQENGILQRYDQDPAPGGSLAPG